MDKAVYAIISLEISNFKGNFYNWNSVLMVKANKAEDFIVNEKLMGYHYNFDYNDKTDVFIFKDSRYKRKKLNEAVEKCKSGILWEVDLIGFEDFYLNVEENGVISNRLVYVYDDVLDTMDLNGGVKKITVDEFDWESFENN